MVLKETQEEEEKRKKDFYVWLDFYINKKTLSQDRRRMVGAHSHAI